VYYVVTSKHLFAERVLILGGGPLARWLASEIEASPHLRYSLVGVVDDGADEEESEQGAVPKAQSFVPLHNVEKAITKLGVQRIIVALRERRGRLPLRELLESTVDGVIIEDGIDVFERITGKIAIETLVPSDILFSGSFRKSHWRLAVARVISFLAALVGVVFLSPVFLVLAIAIKLDSRGPVLFVHRRLGLKNRPFNLFKFRTMAPSTFKTTEWVKDNEARITRLGDWLRNYRLDELPQLFNVIRGDMNLVGPRPHPVTNRRLFMENISYYTLRSMVRPGITGWAQVRYGYANNLEQETEKMRFDLYYIKHMSLWLDVQILLDTARIVLFGRERKERRLTPQLIFIGGRRRGDQPTSYKAELPKPGVPLTHGHAQRNAGP
jgi:exopolysaccharide biosynthesis polyprenyl glycosylphosphotransferase